MLDDRVRAVLARLEEEDARERDEGLPSAVRSRAVEPTTGRFLFALVSPQADCEVLEIGGSRGYSTIWLAAGVRVLRGPPVRPVSRLGDGAARPRPRAQQRAPLAPVYSSYRGKEVVRT